MRVLLFQPARRMRIGSTDEKRCGHLAVVHIRCRSDETRLRSDFSGFAFKR